MKQMNKRGASLTGYGLVVGLIAVVGIGAITSIGGEVDGLFSTVGGELDGVVNDANNALPQASASPSAYYVFTSHTFTSCGQTGVDGPSLGDCQSAYSAAPWASDTNLFNITSPGVQQWTVPDDGTYRITLNGAEGGASSSFTTAGRGGRVVGDITLTGGEILYIVVGQAGEGFDLGVSTGSQYFPIGGFNGGGGTGHEINVGDGDDCANCAHASGGGGTDIRLGGNTLNDRVMVAGGGGGGTTEVSPSTSNKRFGGNGGGLIGHDGQGSNNDDNGAERGRGGTQSAGGAGSNSGRGLPGTFGQGGRASSNDAGGGGGGWYGGGGGGGNGSGGGGSSYTDAVLVSNVTHSQGVNTGDGSVSIELLP